MAVVGRLIIVALLAAGGLDSFASSPGSNPSPSPKSNPSTYFPLQWQAVDMAAASVGGSGITDIAARSNGDLFVGTHQGLALLSNGRWEVDRSGSTKLPDNDIQQLIVHRDQTLWARTQTAIVSVSDSIWKLWDTGAAVAPLSMCESRQGGVWMVAKSSRDSRAYPDIFYLVRLGPRPLAPIKISFQNERDTPYVTTIAELPDGNIWLGTISGVFAVDQHGVATRVESTKPMGTPFVNSILPTSEGTIWIGTDEGLWSSGVRGLERFGLENSPLPSKDIVSIKEDRDGSVWILTKKWEPFTGMSLLTVKLGEYSVAHLKQDVWEVFTPKNSNLPDQPINAIVLDGNGLWLGTDIGLLYGQRSRWSIMNVLHKPGEELVGIQQSADGSLWILTNTTLTVITPSGSAKILFDVDVEKVGGAAIATSPDRQEVWVTFADAMYYFDVRTPLLPHKVTTLDNVAFGGKQLAVARDGSIVFSGSLEEGVFQAKNGQVTELGPPKTADAEASFLDDTKLGKVSAILADPTSDRLVVGTDHGLYILVGDKWTQYNSHTGGLPADRITALALDGPGDLWIGTEEGLSHLDSGGKVSTLSSTNSLLPSNHVTSIAFDSKNGMWIGTTLGLAHVRAQKWQIYDAANNELPGPVRTLLITPDDSIWFAGSQSGLAHFRAPEKTPVTITLANKANNIEEPSHTFGVVAFDSTFQAKAESLRYHWMLYRTHLLSSNDKKVQDLYTSVPFGSFSLTDGSYKLQVTAVDRYGFESEPASQTFSVTLRQGLWSKLVASALKSATLLYLTSFALLFAMIPLYWQSTWIRTAINSGVFTKYSLVHKTILNSWWARRKILSDALRRLVAKTSIPEPYIEQHILMLKSGPVLESANDASGLLDSIFIDSKTAVVMGKSGSGKSVLVQHLFRECVTRFASGKNHYVPLFINLRIDWIDGMSIEDLVTNFFRAGGVELSPDVIKFMVAKGDFVFLIDSLNEVDSTSVRRTLLPFLSSNAANRILIASQSDLLEYPQMKSCKLSGVTSEQAQQYIVTTTGKDWWLEMPVEAQRMTDSPQNLILLSQMFQAGIGTVIPLHRADLYRSILDRDTALTELRLSGNKDMASIYHLALTMIEDVRYSLTADESMELLDRDGVVGSKILEYIRRSRLFNQESKRNAAGITEEVLSFAHETTGKFLASRYLKLTLGSMDPVMVSRLRALADYSRLEESFRFLVDELESKTALGRLGKLLLDQPSEASLRIMAYVIATKDAGQTDTWMIESFAHAQATVQVGEFVSSGA